MGGYHHLQVAVPERHSFTQPLVEQRRLLPAVDQYLPAGRRLDKDGVPLAHVEKGHVQQAVRLRGLPLPGQRSPYDSQGHRPLRRPLRENGQGAGTAPSLLCRRPRHAANQDVQGDEAGHPDLQRNSSGRHLGHYLNHRRRILQEQPGDPGEKLPHGRRDDPRQRRQAAPRHHSRLRRQNEQVGRQAGQRQRLEVVEDEGQRRDLRRQRGQRRLRQRPYGPSRRLLRQETLQPLPRPPREAIRVQHQAQRGGETELEADAPQEEGRDQRHRHTCQTERGIRERRPAEEAAREQIGAGHDRRPYHRGVGADQQRIKGDARHRCPRRAGRPQERPRRHQQDAHQDGHVKAGDGDDVRHTRRLEVLLHSFRETAVIAQQDAAEQGGLLARNEPFDSRLRARLDSKNGLVKDVALSPAQARYLWPRHNAVDALLRQICALPMRFRWRFQLSFDQHPVAIARRREARCQNA